MLEIINTKIDRQYPSHIALLTSSLEKCADDASTKLPLRLGSAAGLRGMNFTPKAIGMGWDLQKHWH